MTRQKDTQTITQSDQVTPSSGLFLSRSPHCSAFRRQAGATMRIKLILFELKTVEDPKL